jgi:hypothetical protein
MSPGGLLASCTREICPRILRLGDSKPFLASDEFHAQATFV